MTIKDIARLAGVDKSTVSRCLNNSSYVNSKTRKKIMDIADKYHFTINASAKTLVTKKTNSVGIIYPSDIDSFEEGLFHISFFSKIKYAFEKERMDVISTLPFNRHTQENQIENLIRQLKIDGLIIMNPYATAQDWEFILQLKFPVIFLHYMPFQLRSSKNIPFIGVDHRHGGKMMIQYAIEKAHKKIVIIANKNQLHSQERWEGICSYLASCQCEDISLTFIVGVDFFVLERLEIESMIENHTIILSLDGDFVSLQILHKLYQCEISIPNDISFISYDNTPISQYTNPAMTTINQPIEQMVRHGTGQLIKYIKQGKLPDEWDQVLFLPDLIERDSCIVNKLL